MGEENEGVGLTICCSLVRECQARGLERLITCEQYPGENEIYPPATTTECAVSTRPHGCDPSWVGGVVQAGVLAFRKGAVISVSNQVYIPSTCIRAWRSKAASSAQDLTLVRQQHCHAIMSCLSFHVPNRSLDAITHPAPTRKQTQCLRAGSPAFTRGHKHATSPTTS